ncbi:hypothetical protein D3C81_1960030 [compost metagenome]
MVHPELGKLSAPLRVMISAWRRPASAAWNAMLRATVFAAMRSCMMAPRIEANPSNVMTISSINTTTSAAPP